MCFATVFPSQLVMLQHRIATVFRENQMVEQGNAEQSPCPFDALGHLQVLVRGIQVSRRVVVGDNQGACPFFDGRSENLSRMDERLADRAERDKGGCQHLVRAIQGDGEKDFLHPLAVMTDLEVQVLGFEDLPAEIAVVSSSQFESRSEKAGLCLSDALNVQEIGDFRILIPVKEVEYLFCQGVDGRFFCAASEQDHHQLKVTEMLGAGLLQALTWPFFDRHMLDGAEMHQLFFVRHTL